MIFKAVRKHTCTPLGCQSLSRTTVVIVVTLSLTPVMLVEFAPIRRRRLHKITTTQIINKLTILLLMIKQYKYKAVKKHTCTVQAVLVLPDSGDDTSDNRNNEHHTELTIYIYIYVCIYIYIYTHMYVM